MNQRHQFTNRQSNFPTRTGRARQRTFVHAMNIPDRMRSLRLSGIARKCVMATVMVVLCIVPSACRRSLSDGDRQTIAQAYAESLIARNLFRADTSAMRRAVDSVARAFGYDDEMDLIVAIRNAAEEPESFRRMLDSTLRVLERATLGMPAGSTTAGPTTTITPADSSAGSTSRDTGVRLQGRFQQNPAAPASKRRDSLGGHDSIIGKGQPVKPARPRQPAR